MKDCFWIVTILFLSILLILVTAGIALAQGEPSVTTNAATNVTTDSATLNGNLTSWGTAPSGNVSFQFATDTYFTAHGNSYEYETTPEVMGGIGPFTADLISLLPDTTYHFRAIAVGDGTGYGNDAIFTTSTIPPAVTTNTATNVTTDSATLDGNLDSLGTAPWVLVSFEWGLTTSYGNETTPGNLTATGPFAADLSGLLPATTYYFRAKAVGNDTSYGNATIFTTAESLNLQGWGWCTNKNQVVAVTFNGYTAMEERTGVSDSYSMHAIGNLTLPSPYDETIPLDMYGSRVRSVFYLRQEVAGKSARFEGTWIDNASGNESYIGMAGTVALPNPEGEVLKTARICFAVLRTPDVEVSITELGSFVQDVDSMLTRFVKFIDKVVDGLIGTGFSEILSNILAKIAVLLAHLRALGTPYIP